jgi:hypothetical protein
MTADELFEQAALNWRDNKGVGTAFVPAPLNNKVLVYQILSRLYARSPAASTVIIVNQFKNRQELIEFLTASESDENNEEFKKLLDNKFIRIFTKDFILNGGWHSSATLCIWYQPEEYIHGVAIYVNFCKYKLIVLNKLFTNNTDSTDLYKVAPLLNCFKQAEMDELRVSTPVEETWVDVQIPEDSEAYKLYQYYCKYIETSLNIFGSFDIMQQARIGNTVLNISSATICAQIAQENGWNEHLDMSFEYNRQIDELYNPNNLRDRATQTYEIIRNRSNLLADYEGKLEKVLELVKEHSGDKILIINKRGEFANKVTEFLNNNSETDICGNYHNKVDNIDAVDVYGRPIYFKSGAEKGKRKSMGARAQMSLNEDKFNLGMINCLSLSNAPDKSLCVEVDVVIITSPLCEDIESYLYRLSNVHIRNGKIKLFSIFCRNTIEQQRLFNKPITETHTIVNKSEFNADAGNKFDFIIAD